MKLTPKQIRLLKAMGKMPVIAPWSSLDLVKLSQLGLVSDAMAIGANGRVHTSKVWTLTDKGQRFVKEDCA